MEEKQDFGNTGGRRGSSWRQEDLLDLERCGLAADLASTNLSRAQVGSPGSWGNFSADDPPVELDFKTYDMSAVLDNLLEDMPLLPPMTPPTRLNECFNRGSTVSMTDLSGSGRDLEVVMRAPTAHGIRRDQDIVTYLNRGQSYEIQFATSNTSTLLYQCTLTLSFCELRWQNSAREHFDQWGRDHPCDRLLEIDNKGSTGLQNMENDEGALNRVVFTWGCGQKSVVLAVKLNCLSTEFAIKKHGGEKGVPLRLVLEMRECKDDILGGQILVYRGACSVKVFKDKGGDRKQRQDQLKADKMNETERSKCHEADSVTRFQPLPLDASMECHTPSSVSSAPLSFQATPEMLCKSSSSTPGNSPFPKTTPTTSEPAAATTTMIAMGANQQSGGVTGGVANSQTVDETQQWLMENRFGQYCSVFSNYTNLDLLRLSRRDLMLLCGQADGIRLFNSLRNTTLKTIYVLLPGEKVYQAVYLDKLTATCLLHQLVLKLGWLSIDLVGSFVQLVPNLSLLVKVEDSLVQAMQDQDVFSVQTVKQEDGYYQLVIQYHYPTLPDVPLPQLSLNLEGSSQRRQE